MYFVIILFVERGTLYEYHVKGRYYQGIPAGDDGGGDRAGNLRRPVPRACAGYVNGEVCDLRTPVTGDCELAIATFEDAAGKKAFWHTSSHILAQAVKRLYPRRRSWPSATAIENGFYYDSTTWETPFTQSDLEKLEAEMKKIVKEKLPIERFELSREEALELMKESPYKLELIEEHAKNATRSGELLPSGGFVDLCAGPHLPDTGRVKALKLTAATGAYWRADQNNKMLCRVYGVSFPKAAELEAHLTMLEEARKRDHNKLGRELELFTTSEVIGQGLPILLPKGARIVQLLQRFVEDEEEKRGYLLTKTPFMAKSDLYKISGHWNHYYDGMFVLATRKWTPGRGGSRPASHDLPVPVPGLPEPPRSYRDLPLRYNETSTLFRNEASGECTA